MKILPCGRCNDAALMSRGRNGGPSLYHTVGGFTGGIHRYTCKRCGQVGSFTSAQFNRLPDMTEDQLIHESCSVTWPPASEAIN